MGLAAQDHIDPPSRCEPNKQELDGSGEYSPGGVTGLKTTRVYSALKETICRNHPRPGTGAFDTRVIDGLVVSAKAPPQSNACKTQVALGPRAVTIHCGKDGKDSESEWNFALTTNGWFVSAPKLRQRTLSGSYPAGRPLAVSVDISNRSGRRHQPNDGDLVIKATGAVPPTRQVGSATLPAMDTATSATVGVSVTPTAPGVYAYAACLSGVRDGGGWPVPDICGQSIQVTVGPPAQGAPPAFGVIPQLRPLPGAPLQGAPARIPPQQATPPVQAVPQQAIIPGPQGAIPQGAVPVPQGSPPEPQAAAPASGGLECRGGEVRGILCWCGLGRFPRPLGNNVYQCQ